MPKKSKPASKSLLRVISGNFKGVKILSPSDNHKIHVHPMGSREKIALFNILQPYFVPQMRILDAFAGTGALGIEALSRGAREVVFVEKDPHVARLIVQNLIALGSQIVQESPNTQTSVQVTLSRSNQSAQVIISDVSLAVQELAAGSFDLILADPPYDHFMPEQIDALTSLLGANGILALSHPRITPRLHTNKKGSEDQSIAPNLPNLTLLSSRTYAAAQITIYQKPAS